MKWGVAILISALFCAGVSAQETTSAIVALAQKKSLEEAGQVYPQLRDENSTLWQIAHRLAMQARDPNSIYHNLLGSPNAPRIFADMAVKVLIADQGGQPQPLGEARFVRVTRPGPVKTTIHKGWSISVGEAYPFVRFMSTREYEAGGMLVEQTKSDSNYAVLKIDDDLLMVPVDALEEVPVAGARFTSAQRDYDAEVRNKQTADARAAQGKQ